MAISLFRNLYIRRAWPDFNEFEFLKAIIDYQSRNRRFGGIESFSKNFSDSQYSSAQNDQYEQTVLKRN